MIRNKAINLITTCLIFFMISNTCVYANNIHDKEQEHTLIEKTIYADGSETIPLDNESDNELEANLFNITDAIDLLDNDNSQDENGYTSTNSTNGISITTASQEISFESDQTIELDVTISTPKDYLEGSHVYIGYLAVLDDSSWNQLSAWYIDGGTMKSKLLIPSERLRKNENLVMLISVFSADNYVAGASLCDHIFFMKVGSSNITSGSCGNGVNWNFENHVLYISGNGEMQDYYDTFPPWSQYRNQIYKVNIDEGITHIGDYAFAQCDKLDDVLLPSYLELTGKGIFYKCTSLVDIILPDSIIEVEEGAFYGCKSLKNVHLPSNLSVIGKYAFGECSNLSAISFPDSITEIGDYAFSFCEQLNEVSLPKNLSSISNYTFAKCKNLSIVRFSENIVKTGEGAFAYCEKLKDISLSAKLKKIGKNAFAYCNSLSSIVLTDGVTEIGEGAFGRCENLKSISLPPGLNRIDKYTFAFCCSLNSISLPDGVTEIDEGAFGCCENLERIDLPRNLKSIGDYAFLACRMIGDVNFSETLEVIGDSAFSLCDSLLNINIPQSVNQLKQKAFCGCKGLKSVSVSGPITEITSQFNQCANLQCIRIPGEVINIDKSAFEGCNNLSDVYFGGTAEQWKSIINNSSNLDHINLFLEINRNDSKGVVIETRDIPGGIEVIMSSSNEYIYYSMDGSMPCTASTCYTKPFVIDKAGSYSIKAISVDSNMAGYSNASEKLLSMTRSLSPVFSKVDNRVFIEPTENVYYSFDLMKTPDTSDLLYKKYIAPKKNTAIRARVIENGKEPSEVVTYQYCAEKPKKYQLEVDGYSFGNKSASFGYGDKYRISENRYKEAFGPTKGKAIFEDWAEDWGGSCFGMSSTSLLFQNKMLSVADYNETAHYANDLKAPGSPDNILTALIERYQIAQFSDEVMNERFDDNMVYSGDAGYSTEANNLINAVNHYCTTGDDPVILTVFGNSMNCHAVVPYKVENDKIYVYDCNHPNNVNKYIKYSKNYIQKEVSYTFEYGNYSHAISYTLMSTLLGQLENLQSDNAVPFSDEKELMLISVNTPDFDIYDSDGKKLDDYSRCYPTEDMNSDYTLLYLPVGDYHFENHDNTISTLKFSFADNEGYYSAEMDNSSAAVYFGRKNNHLYFQMNSDKETQLKLKVVNDSDHENNIVISSDFVSAHAYSDQAVSIQSNASVAQIDGENVSLKKNDNENFNMFTEEYYKESDGQDFDCFEGAMIGKNVSDVQDKYEVKAEKNTDSDNTEIVMVRTPDNGCLLYAAEYDSTGKCIKTSSVRVPTGETRYDMAIDDKTKTVKYFLTRTETWRPVAEAVIVENNNNQSGIPLSVQVKDTVTFGSYEQDNNLENGKEPIEWIVLKKENGKALLLSKYCLDAQQYNKTYTGVTWEICTLRSWLNSTFLNEAFSSSQQSQIPTITVQNPDTYLGCDSSGTPVINNTGEGITDLRAHISGGNSTKDQIFLLSIDEAKSLLGDESKSLYNTAGLIYRGYPNMQASVTAYAKAQGARTCSYCTTAEGKVCCYWWLRSSGGDSYLASSVYCDGYVNYLNKVYEDCYVVRPALWVNLTA